MTMKKYTKYKIKEWSKDYKSYIVTQRKNSPMAPSEEVLKIHYDNLFGITKRFKNPRMLVLGMTPELRDLGLHMGFEVIAVDFNWNMIKKMNELVGIKIREKEIIIKGNWLGIPLRDNYFHCVVSDVSINNLALNDFPRLFKKLQSILVSGGCISIKEAVHPDSDKQINAFEKNVELYRKKKMSFNDFYLRARFMTSRHKTYNEKTKINSGKKVFEEFKRVHKKSIINKKEFERLYKLYNVISHTILKQSEFLRIFKRYFKLISIKQSDSDKYDFYPLKVFLGKVKK